MNVQQLNQNGQNIWVFFVTALIALLVTGGSWVLSNAVYKAVSWYKNLSARSAAYDGKDAKQEYDFTHRVAMLVWLVRNGQTAWMWTTGAWLAILINSKEETEAYVHTGGGVVGMYAACDYVDAISPSKLRSLDHVQWSPISE